MKKISLDGKIVDSNKASLFVGDKAVWYDFGVYESVKVLQGTLFYPELHVRRLFESAQIIDLHLGLSESDISGWLGDFKDSLKLQDHVIRICAYGDTEKSEKARIYMYALGLTFYPDKFYTRGVRAITIEGERFMPRAKTVNLLQGFLAYREARKKGAFEGIMVDRGGSAREGVRSSLFIVRGEGVITPPDEWVLDGVTRGLVMRLCKEHHIGVEKRDISKEQVYDADEVFVTATVMNVLPIVEIDGKVIGNGVVGGITRKLVKSFSKMQKEYVRSK